MHPRSEIEREYICRVHGEVPDEVLENLKRGVELEDGPAHFDDIAVISRGGSHSWFRVVIREGRNREVRRMWESQGLMVSRLKRIRYGNIELPRLLRRGQCEEVAPELVATLREKAGMPDRVPRLTLAPVIGQRRAPPTEFKPTAKSQQAWTGGAHHEEAREFAAFDRIRDDAGGHRRENPAPNAAALRDPEADNGDQAPASGLLAVHRVPAQVRVEPGGPGRKPNKQPRGHAASVYKEPGLSPAVLRSWFPESTTGAGAPEKKSPESQAVRVKVQAPVSRATTATAAYPQRTADNIGNTDRLPGPTTRHAGQLAHEGAPRGPGPRNNKFRRRGPKPPPALNASAAVRARGHEPE